MKYQYPAKGQKLDSEQYTEFADLLEQLVNRRLTGTEEDFVTEMYERHQQYGKETYVSDNQFNWLRRINDRFMK